MPAGEAFAPGRGPSHNVFGHGLLPEGKVKGVALVGLPFEFAGTGFEVVNAAARQFSVGMFLEVGLNAEVHAAVGFVGIAVGKKLLNELHLLHNMAGCRGFNRGR